MLVPFVLLGTLAQATPVIHAYSWSPVPADCRAITPLVWLRVASKPADLAAETAKQPEGRRAVFSWDLHRELLAHPQDVCRTADGQPTTVPGVWPEHGIAAVKAKFERFFTDYKAAGGQLDVFVLDFEGNYSNWAIGGMDKPERWRAITADPRFAGLAARLGFDDLMTVANFRSGRNYLRWNAVMAGLVDEALEEAVFRPIRALYPKVLASNYGSYATTEANAVPDLNGHLQYGEGAGVGSHQSSEFYCWLGQVGDRVLAGNKPLGRSAYAGLLRAINQLRAMQRSSPRPIMPWVAWQRYAGDGPGLPIVPIAGTPYWQELVRHLALAGCDTFLFWNPHPWAANQKAESFSQEADERLLDQILGDLDQRLAGQRRTPASVSAIAWDAPCLATGLRVDDRVIWRVTLPAGAQRLKMVQQGKSQVVDLEPGTPGAWCVTGTDIQPEFHVE